MGLVAFSYGGGVQSTAALVLAARGDLDCRLFLFANVGDDSENPATLDYVRDVAAPYAAEHGLELVELSRGGKRPTLLGLLEGVEKSLPIPVRMDGSGAPGNRTCTFDYKVTVVRRELKKRGASVDDPARLMLGITVDEVERVRTPLDRRTPELVRDYPLIDLELDRQDCRNVIAGAGLPIPERSSCWFCPFHKVEEWRRLQRARPDLFDRSVELEKMLQARRTALGRDPVWLTDAGARDRLTLDRVVGLEPQLSLDDDVAGCESGFCMT